jgi:hypothetical protein
MRSRSLVAAALLVFTAACGARSTLRDPAQSTTGSGGAGTATGTSTGTSAGTSTGMGTTGAGGSAFALCAGLIDGEPTIALPVPGSSARDPLLLAGLDGTVIALTRHEPVESPGIVPSTISAIVLQPWGTWPPPIVSTHTQIVDDMWAVPFAASVEPKGTLAVLVERFPKNSKPSCQLGALYGVAADGAPNPTALTLSIDGGCDDVPVSIATAGNGTHFLAASRTISPKGHGSSFKQITADGTTVTSAQDHCASTAIVGDMIPGETDLLFVNATSDNDPCFNGGTEAPGPARKLLLRHQLVVGIEGLTTVYDGADDVVYTRLLPRKGGSWLLFRESGASAEVQPPGMAMPLGPDGATGEPFPVTSDGTDRVAAAALGDGFVVAFVDSLDPSAPNIVLRVYSATGALSAQTSFDTNGAWLNGDRLTLVGSPDGRSFLVGWTGDQGSVGNTLFMRRFDCVTAD